MNNDEYNRLCAVFLKTFASVPYSLRSQIIVVVNGKPFTWESVFVEVKAKTEKSKEIIKTLKKLEIIS
jgi:hypothetical protein